MVRNDPTYSYVTLVHSKLVTYIVCSLVGTTTNGDRAHMACGRIQTASEAPNERGRYATCVHALASPVGRAWWLLQSGQIAAWRICSFLHASAAVQEISCSGRCGPSLPALRASADAHGSWASATASEKNP
jgi:hypothetical protein